MKQHTYVLPFHYFNADTEIFNWTFNNMKHFYNFS